MLTVVSYADDFRYPQPRSARRSLAWDEGGEDQLGLTINEAKKTSLRNAVQNASTSPRHSFARIV